MAATSRSRRTSTKAKPAPEPEVLEDELDGVEEADTDELEELDETEVAEAAPAKKKAGKKKDDDITFGIHDLIELIKTETGETTDPRSLRTLIRKMARETDREGGPRVNREIKAGNRTRYNWEGPNNPEVRSIVDAFKGGELEADKKAKLAELKRRKAEQQAEKKKTTAATDTVDEVEEVDGADEDLDFDEVDD